MTANVDIQAIAARARAAREVEITVACGWTFKLRRPSDYVMMDALASPRAREAPSQFQAEQVERALIGWDGPKVGDVDPDASDEVKALALPFDAVLFDALLGDRPKVLNEIGAKLLDGYMDRMNHRGEQAKNSPSSSASAPA